MSETERFDIGDHVADVIEIALFRLTPRRPHAEARGRRPLCRLRRGDAALTSSRRISFSALTPAS